MDVWYVTQFLQIQSLHTLSFNWASSSVDVTSQDVTGEGGEWLGGWVGGGVTMYSRRRRRRRLRYCAAGQPPHPVTSSEHNSTDS